MRSWESDPVAQCCRTERAEGMLFSLAVREPARSFARELSRSFAHTPRIQIQYNTENPSGKYLKDARTNPRPRAQQLDTHRRIPRHPPTSSRQLSCGLRFSVHLQTK